MKIRVSGCSGGIAKGGAITSFLVDDDILIAAGTSVGDLSLSISEMKRIMEECHQALPDWPLYQLKSGDRFKL